VNRDGTTVFAGGTECDSSHGIAQHAIVLEVGKVMVQGDSQKLLKSDEIRKAYLGN